MIQSASDNYTFQLQHLMQNVGISSFKQLSKKAGISEKQLQRLRSGKIAQMRLETLLKISASLQVSISELCKIFGNFQLNNVEIEPLKQEYQRLQIEIQQQRETLFQEFQQNSLQVLESFLIYFPTAATKAQENPQMPATQILPLIKPMEKLIKQWGVEAIAIVGEEIAYDPQWHQLIDSTAEKGDKVKVRYTGYRQGEKLLYRAKVSPI